MTLKARLDAAERQAGPEEAGPPTTVIYLPCTERDSGAGPGTCYRAGQGAVVLYDPAGPPPWLAEGA